ncbi:MAG: NTP transferase domain-containing protein [Chloroflexi bacterium]|nr:NTP transferase domain-containing protein [Chloroflexota bacterium]
MKIVILLAGLGTRLRPHTLTKPKPLVNVAGKPILGHILDQLQGIPSEEYIFVVGYLGEQIEEYVKSHYQIPARFVFQEEPKGQAHAINLAGEHLTGPFLSIFGDTIFEADLTPIQNFAEDGLIFVKEIDDPRRYGIAIIREGWVKGFVEKPEKPESNLALVGLYYIRNTPLFLECVQEVIRRDMQFQGEYYLAHALQLMADKGARLKATTTAVWEDCGSLETLLATQRYLLDKNGGQSGETENSVIISPVYIAPTARIFNSVVGPYVSVAEGSSISDSMIRDSIINEGAAIEGAMLEKSIIGANAQVRGNFRHLDVGDSSKVDLG